ncbi:hypothetical protein [Allokutzneria sp. NRRL B-24872]|uniref:hypothetical protein n=1 Tax=Allokutzneria sp. NRRL B-24872 TaxID=1137961 RepID=UPI000A3AE717|nr:hypothetical protein [Allokutzneria sp. NRRL B-24872]
MRTALSLTLAAVAALSFTGTAGAAEPRANVPDCVSYRLQEPVGIFEQTVHITNNCRTSQTVRVDIAFALDSECVSVLPFTTKPYTFLASHLLVRGLASC